MLETRLMSRPEMVQLNQVKPGGRCGASHASAWIRRAEEEFFRLQRRMARRARAKGILTERQVERLVFQDR